MIQFLAFRCVQRLFFNCHYLEAKQNRNNF